MTGPSPPPAAAAKPRFSASAVALSLLLFGTLALTLYRLGLWLNYRPEDSPGGLELARAFFMGARFDLKWLATLAVPALLLGAALPAAARPRALGLYALVVFVLLNFLAIINHFYFGFFGSTIDPMIFGAIEDDTAIVVHTIVHDARLIPVLAVCPGPVRTEFGAVSRRSPESRAMPAKKSFYVPKEQVVAESLVALDRKAARVYPGLKTAVAALVLSALPMVVLRFALGFRPRR